MGYVYKAFDTERNCHVVIKVPNEMVLQNEGHRKRFEREYLALRELSHPNVVTIYEAREARQLGNIPYAVMQYLAGGDLSGRLSNDPAKLREWLPAIAEALDYVHQHQHIHRDVKPGNILFDAEGKAYLSDFGIIKIAHDAQNQKTNLTGTGMFIGTPDYMAPEIHDGETVGGPVDQYALAVIVYEALAGKLPFNGKTPIAIAIAHKTEQAAPIPEMFTEVNDAIMKGISKEPSQRYSSCVEFAEAVLSAVTIMIKHIKWKEEEVAKVREIEQEAFEEQQRVLHEGGVYGPNSVLHLNYRNGQKKSSTHYKNGKQHGPYAAWHENGQKKLEYHYKNGKLDGLCTDWHENGQKETEIHYKNGKQGDGLETWWYDNGQKEREGHYKDGEEDGLWTLWYESGNKQGEGRWKNGKEEGLWTLWYESGNKQRECRVKNGKEEGLWTTWDKDGNKTLEVQYKDGKEVSRKEF